MPRCEQLRINQAPLHRRRPDPGKDGAVLSDGRIFCEWYGGVRESRGRKGMNVRPVLLQFIVETEESFVRPLAGYIIGTGDLPIDRIRPFAQALRLLSVRPLQFRAGHHLEGSGKHSIEEQGNRAD